MAKILTCILLWALTLPYLAHGQISLSNSPYLSRVFTYAGSGGASSVYPENVSYVNSFPYSAITMSSEDEETSGDTAALSSSSLTFNISETLGDSDSTDEASALIYFTPDTNVTFSLEGTSTLTGSASASTFFLSLIDLTTNTSVYGDSFYPSSSGVTTFTSGLGQGSLTGSLTAGDLYQFSPGEELSTASTSATPVSVSDSFDINFTDVPEPSVWAMMLLGLGAVFFCVHRKLAQVRMRPSSRIDTVQ